MEKGRRKLGATRDMTEGGIAKQLVLFALPLIVGNIFQMLYNTVDSVVVGQYVGKEALAAVNSTTMIVNMLVFFFNGFSVGAGVIIARRFGAKDHDALHEAIETTMAFTFVLCVVFSVVGAGLTGPMLRFMSTPEDVMEDARAYLGIYFMGISGLLIYNMGAGILRAVGDTTRPLLFLVFTSLMNIALDLLFVLAFHMGIAGVAWATVISQAISAALTLALLTRAKDVYRLSWKELRIRGKVLYEIFQVGLPAGIQSVITAFSNVFVQSYINFFGSSCMAGWGCYNKLDQFIMLPMSSMAMAATTFVSQNMGAKKEDRADRGSVTAILMAVGVTAVIAAGLVVFAEQAVRLFSPDESVVEYGALFIHGNVFFLLFNCVNHVLAGALRGRGDSRGPMVIMLLTFVAARQVYLFVVTKYISNTPFLVGFGYPVGWMACCALEVAYYHFRWGRGRKKEAEASA